MDEARRPFQYALSTRSGMECMGHLFRPAIDTDSRLCILSIDATGAIDHVLRASILRKLSVAESQR